MVVVDTSVWTHWCFQFIMSYVKGKVKTGLAFIHMVTLPLFTGILISFLEYERIRYNATDVLEIIHNLPSNLF